MRPSTPKAITAVLATEMRRRIADRSIIVSSLVAPAVIAGIIGFAFGAAGSTKQVTIGVAFDAPTAHARSVVTAGIASAGFGSSVRVVLVASPGRLEHEVRTATIGAGVIVPRGFAAPGSFGLGGRVASTPGPSSSRVSIRTTAEPVSALPGLLANVTVGPGNGPAGARLTVEATSTSSLQGQTALALAAAISSRVYAGALVATTLPTAPGATEATLAVAVARAEAAASVPVKLDVGVLDIGNNHAVIGYYGSSMAVVFLFIGAGLGTRAIAMERTRGTLSRLAAAPVSSTAVVVGKMLAVLVTAFAGLIVLWAETVVLFGATWGNVAGVLTMCALSALAMCSLAMFLTSLAKDEAQAYAASIIVGIVLAIVGGNFFPPGSLPGFFQFVSLCTPNGWALVGFGRLALTNARISGIVSPLVVLGAISIVFVTASSVRIRRVVEL